MNLHLDISITRRFAESNTGGKRILGKQRRHNTEYAWNMLAGDLSKQRSLAISLRTGQSGLFAKYIRLIKGFLDKHIPSPVKYFRTYHYVYVLVDTVSTADILPELHVKQIKLAFLL